MNFLTEDHFNSSMASPPIAAEVIKMLVEDLSILVAIMGGPNASEDTYMKIIREIGKELLSGATLTHSRLEAHLNGATHIFLPKIILPQ